MRALGQESSGQTNPLCRQFCFRSPLLKAGLIDYISQPSGLCPAYVGPMWWRRSDLVDRQFQKDIALFVGLRHLSRPHIDLQ